MQALHNPYSSDTRKKLEKESPLEKDKLELLNEINDTNADRLTEIYNHMYMETLRQKYKIMK